MHMPLQWRQRSGCPELGNAADCMQPVPGSKETFPDCPMAYLRGASDIASLRSIGVADPMDDHLIDGGAHPGSIVGEVVFELESGSRNVETISPKALGLCHLWLNERSSRDDYRAEQRKARHG